MLKSLVVTLLSVISSNCFAAGGYTWLGGLSHTLHVPEKVLTFTLVGTVLTLMGLVYRFQVASVDNVVIPDKNVSLRSFVEAYGQFIYGQAKSVIGEKEAHKYFPFIATLFIFIFLNNITGLIPGFLPPTEYLETTLALGIVAFVYYNYKGCKELGTLNYLKHFAGPIWYMAFLIFPIEILSNFIRPISLALRLRGNMYGDHIVLSVFSELAPGGLILPIIFLFMGLFVSLVQAYVFTMLTMVYISLATAHHDHDEDHH